MGATITVMLPIPAQRSPEAGPGGSRQAFRLKPPTAVR